MMKIRIMGVTDILITHANDWRKASLVIESTDSSGKTSHTVLELESDSDVLKEIKNGAVV